MPRFRERGEAAAPGILAAAGRAAETARDLGDLSDPLALIPRLALSANDERPAVLASVEDKPAVEVGTLGIERTATPMAPNRLHVTHYPPAFWCRMGAAGCPRRPRGAGAEALDEAIAPLRAEGKYGGEISPIK